ncbi:MAG: DUF2190 family protein [Candidatus Bathyarchaeia archaeon]
MSVDARIAGNIYSLPGQIVSFTAGADITKGQPVYITGDMTVLPATSRSHKVIGVAVTNAASGKPVSVLMGCPIVYMTAGAAITAGSHVVAGTAGKVVPADVADQAVNEGGTATYTFSASYIIGIAVEGAAAADAVIRVAVAQQIVCLTP